ncbi:MAG TPA: hypothetical protein VGM47_07355 [Gammaproteobacteria bacterium]|jgi:hypothetical protein
MLVMPPGAKRISSRATFFYKLVFPVIWFVALGLVVLFGLLNTSVATGTMLPFLIMPIFMVGIGYVIFRALLVGLMDEVWDNGTELLVVNGRHVEHVPLSGIVNINYSGLTNPKRATLQLRLPGRWGTKLSFIPVRSSMSIWNLMDNKMIDGLIERVDEARRNP